MTEIVSRVCKSRDVSANLIFPESQKNNYNFLDKLKNLVNNLLMDGRCRIRVDYKQKEKEEAMIYRRFFIVVINEIEEIFELLTKNTSTIFNFRKLLVLNIFNGNEESIKNISSIVWQRKFFNIILVYSKNNSTTSIATFLPFQNQSCHTATFKIINEFKDDEFLEPIDEFFPQKFRDLGNCPLRFAACLDAIPCSFVKTLKNGTKVPGGSDVEVVTALSKQLNFKINYIFRNTQGFIESNGKSDGNKIIFDLFKVYLPYRDLKNIFTIRTF